MHSTTLIVTRYQKDFPQFSFVDSDTFSWSPRTNTIYYNSSSFNQEDILHEISHALLNHNKFYRDIELITMERDAWNYAQQHLAPIYLPKKKINESIIQDALDTYRDWLHARSTCPHCSATGLQTAQKSYTCLVCNCLWKVNDARGCALRRYTLK